jgi:F-type H+-transporting ATPase subunit gamma
MQTIIDNVTSNVNMENAPEIIKGKENNKTHLIILMTSDRGLCGGFNSAITKLAKKKIKNLLNSNKTVKIFCIGKKGLDHLKREFNELIIDSIPISTQKRIDYEFAEKISNKILLMYENEEFDVAHTVFSLFTSAIKQNVAIQIFSGLLENAAGEQGARMTAMDNATRNAGELIDTLTLNYNRSRQAQITNELIEVISGAEAI